MAVGADPLERVEDAPVGRDALVGDEHLQLGAGVAGTGAPFGVLVHDDAEVVLGEHARAGLDEVLDDGVAEEGRQGRVQVADRAGRELLPAPGLPGALGRDLARADHVEQLDEVPRPHLRERHVPDGLALAEPYRQHV
ncbi:MAG: hypothetical protein MUF10_15420 [Thermoanaerobaculaceae bacterium]|nr:hypothetical protein [Thermoanaerobaculaceae bacterium]